MGSAGISGPFESDPSNPAFLIGCAQVIRYHPSLRS